MRIEYPFELELIPQEINSGMQWLTLRIKNIGSDTLKNLEVTAHSLDTAGLYVYGTGEYIHELKPNEEVFKGFQVLANATTEVFGSISGLRDKERQRFWIETPPVEITVTEEVAKLESIFALTEPYTTMGKVIKVEAKVKGLKDSKNLDLVFKADDTSGELKSLGKIEIKQLDAGQEAKFTTEVTPNRTGIYTIHAYLHHYWKRIGHKWDTIYVEE
jgi:hypothetical protein